MFDFNIAVFDLDWTLWDGERLYPHVEDILKTLQKQKVQLYLASYNTKAIQACESLAIKKYFSSIAYGRGIKKSQMIENLLENVKEKNKIVFFDDDIRNIIDVQMTLGIQSIHVNKGLKWIHINNASLYC